MDAINVGGKKRLMASIQTYQESQLLEYKANINHKDDEGTPIIQYAVENESVEVVKFLIDKGVDINVTDQYGLSPLVYALKTKNKAIVDLIRSAGGEY